MTVQNGAVMLETLGSGRGQGLKNPCHGLLALQGAAWSESRCPEIRQTTASSRGLDLR